MGKERGRRGRGEGEERERRGGGEGKVKGEGKERRKGKRREGRRGGDKTSINLLLLWFQLHSTYNPMNVWGPACLAVERSVIKCIVDPYTYINLTSFTR